MANRRNAATVPALDTSGAGDDFDISPAEILFKTFSVQSVTTDKFIKASGLDCLPWMAPTTNPPRMIGMGSCGTVYELPGTEHAFKKSGNEKALWNDFHLTNRMAAALMQVKTLLVKEEVAAVRLRTTPRTPICSRFITTTDDYGRDWWRRNQYYVRENDEEEEEDGQPLAVFSVQRIPSLPLATRFALIEHYFPPSDINKARSSDFNKACLARVYLGARRDSAKNLRYLNLWNFELHLDQLEELQIETEELASEMAIGLAIAHWQARIDCADTEFVLGSAAAASYPELFLHDPNYASTQPHSSLERNIQHRTTHLWMLDFDKAQTFEFTQHDVETKLLAAVVGNDPYFPSPAAASDGDQRLWECFKAVYLEVSQVILMHIGADERVRMLPELFVGKWAERAIVNQKFDEEYDFFEN